MLTITVMICSYHRPNDLRRCLLAIGDQTLPPEKIIVVAREGDVETEAVLQEFSTHPQLRVLKIAAPGVVAARNLGLAAVRTDLIALCDDDTAPHPRWLERIEARFRANERLGGLGGKDRCVNHPDCDQARASVVGRLQFFGRMIGNHHAGFGAVRRVDLLKGANMSYRTSAIGTLRFDSRLRGEGAQAHEDMAFSLAVGHSGWDLLYDPEILVEHFESPREEPRHYAAMLPVTDTQAYADVTYNYVLAINDVLSRVQRPVYVAWQILVGTRVSPGFVQAIRFTRALGRGSWQRFWITQMAMLAAYRDLRKAGTKNRPDRLAPAQGVTALRS